MKLKYVSILCVICLASGAYIQKAYFGTVQNETVNKADVETVIKEVVHADGTKSIETVIKDKSVSKQVQQQRAPDWMIGISQFSKFDGSDGRNYLFQVNRRVIGPVWLGAFATSSKLFGISAIVEF